MSSKFYAVNRETGERGEPKNSVRRNYLVMYDSGFLAEVQADFDTFIRPLDPKVWQVVIKENILN